MDDENFPVRGSVLWVLGPDTDHFYDINKMTIRYIYFLKIKMYFPGVRNHLLESDRFIFIPVPPLDCAPFHSVCSDTEQRTILNTQSVEHVKVCCCFLSPHYAVFQWDPGCWRSRVCVTPCCSILSYILKFSFRCQPRSQWPPRLPPPHPLLRLFLLFHTLRWTIFVLFSLM